MLTINLVQHIKVSNLNKLNHRTPFTVRIMN